MTRKTREKDKENDRRKINAELDTDYRALLSGC
jgi:hypothetical protein